MTSNQPQPAGDDNEILECVSCHRRTTRVESEFRNFSTGLCGRCGYGLKPAATVQPDEKLKKAAYTIRHIAILAYKYGGITKIELEAMLDKLIAIAVTEAQVKGQLKEAETILHSRSIDTDAYFCEFCHMELEDLDQECACIIIANKRLVVLDAELRKLQEPTYAK